MKKFAATLLVTALLVAQAQAQAQAQERLLYTIPTDQMRGILNGTTHILTMLAKPHDKTLASVQIDLICEKGGPTRVKIEPRGALWREGTATTAKITFVQESGGSLIVEELETSVDRLHPIGILEFETNSGLDGMDIGFDTPILVDVNTGDHTMELLVLPRSDARNNSDKLLSHLTCR